MIGVLFLFSFCEKNYVWSQPSSLCGIFYYFQQNIDHLLQKRHIPLSGLLSLSSLCKSYEHCEWLFYIWDCLLIFRKHRSSSKAAVFFSACSPCKINGFYHAFSLLQMVVYVQENINYVRERVRKSIHWTGDMHKILVFVPVLVLSLSRMVNPVPSGALALGRCEILTLKIWSEVKDALCLYV